MVSVNLQGVSSASTMLFSADLGIVTPEMGAVLFRILTRVLDDGLYAKKTTSAPSRRAKAVKLRPKLAELLTLEERRAWRKAVASAPSDFLRRTAESRPHRTDSEKANGGARVAVSAAS